MEEFDQSMSKSFVYSKGIVLDSGLDAVDLGLDILASYNHYNIPHLIDSKFNKIINHDWVDPFRTLDF